MTEKLLKRIFWISGGVLFAAGLVGWYDRIVNGHANMAYSDLIPWGLGVASYIYFIGLSAGSFLISSLVYVFNVRRFEKIGRLALFTAVVTLSLALLTIWSDIGHMTRAWEVLAYPNFRSPMAWMIWLYSGYFLLLVSELWFVVRRDLVAGASVGGARGLLYRTLALGSRDAGDESARRDKRVVRVLATIGVPLAVMFHGGVGALFGVLIARPLWNGGMYPIIFLVSALASGGALLTLVSAIFQDGLRRNRDTVVALGQLVLGLLLADLLLQISDYVVTLYGNVPEDAAALQLVMGGPFSWVFWGWQIGIGTLVPLALLAFPTRKDPRWVSFAGLLIAAGFLGVRLNIVVPGLAAEELKGIAQAVSSPRFTTSYFPSLTEWLLVVGIAGFGLLLFGVGELLLPEEQPLKEAVPERPVAIYAREEHTGRRVFVRAAVATGAATLLGTQVPRFASFGSKEHALTSFDEGRTLWGREAGQWIASCCNMCGGQSGVLAHVVNGVVDKIEPNHWNPNNYTNISADFFDGYTERYGCKEGGALCAKGNAAVAQLYDPDRVKTPLKRTNPDRSVGADPGFVPVTWDQALDEIAAKMKTLRDAGEAHKLLWFSEDGSFVDPQQDFCKLYGTPNYSNHSNLCDVARKASFTTVMGNDRPLPDFMQSKYILLFGWNPTSAIKWVYLPRILTRAVERGARLVVVDPYLSDTAAKAQEWVSIRPATDGALALAMANVIIRDELYDKEFVAKWTTGFDEYAAYVKDKTPAWAEQITTVPAATIERIAHEFATTKPALADVWSGPGQHSNGVQGGRAVAMLNALVGAYDRPGTMLIADRRGPKRPAIDADATAAATLAKPRFDELEKYPLGHASGVYARAFTNLAEGKGPYQPKMLVSVFQNLMMSVPGSQTVAKALSKIETVVVIDTMLSETAMMADYVLPGTTYLERYDLNLHWVTWPVIGLRQPVVKPIFGQLAEYETVAALGRRLGLKDKTGREHFTVGYLSGKPIESLTAWYEDYLSAELKNGAPGITLAELKALPGAVWMDKVGTRFQKYQLPVSATALQTAVYEGDPTKDGTLVLDKPRASGGAPIGVIVDGMALAGFNTRTRRVDFSAAWLAAKTDANGKAIAAVPAYTPRDWLPSAEYPLYLINWKEASHTHTRTQNNALLLEIKPENPLAIHPDTAAKYGVRDGDLVTVESPHGKVTARAKVTKRMHPEVVGLQHGFGHTALGRNARGRGTRDALLRPTLADPLSGQALHKENCVRIARA
ncbi:MAG TPA: NrfD/PsrC family molybdoenzyme membrane anchor subunit [Candidatus Limnocylindria bacterium]|nr:NrfD/PsrC family molybdoenzyme membrane anchor subunit [Candidatus Limnocylindria bacterium]